MDDCDVHALLVEASSRLEAEQAAADNHGAAARLGGDHHRVDVIEIAIGDTPARSLPGTGMMKGTEPVAITSLS